MKLSESKVSLPGAKQVFRRFGGGMMAGDLISLASEPTPAGTEPLAAPRRPRRGPRRPIAPTLADLRDRFRERFASLTESFKRLESPPVYPVEMSQPLAALRDATAAALEGPG